MASPEPCPNVDQHSEASDQDTSSHVCEESELTKQSPPSEAGSQALKDGSKRKRASKTAKLRQTKLDVRREQWLAQVTAKVKSKPPEITPSPEKGDSKDECQIQGEVESPEAKYSRKEKAGLCYCKNDLSQDCPSTGITGAEEKLSKGKEIAETGECSQSSEASTLMKPVKHLGRSISQPVSQGILETKEERPAESKIGEKGFTRTRKSKSKQEDTLDDWETAADAILPEETSSFSGLQVVIPAGGLPTESADSKSKSPGPAWRLDDSCRPQTLPRLSKLNSMPIQSSSGSVWETTIRHTVWGPPPAPSFCPICTEELDGTDSSFCPCPCGFRLCLFCHHRIAMDDGRCPGCRKRYSADVSAKVERYIQVPLHRSHMIRLKV